MFGWLKGKKQDDPKLRNAHEMGQRFAEGFANDLSAYMTSRFEPVRTNYLDVFQTSLNNCLSPVEAPPIISARIEFDIFIENIGKLNTRMAGEISSLFSEHLELFGKLGLPEAGLELINAQVQRFCNELTEAGLQRLLDMANALKSADTPWRAKNAELSAKFPLES